MKMDATFTNAGSIRHLMKKMSVMRRHKMNWEYEKHVEYRGKTYHLWSAIHREGYRAFTLTHHPADTMAPFVKPQGSGHWTSLESVSKRTGIPFESLKGART